MVPFDRACATSYSSSVVTMALSCAVSEIQRDNVAKMQFSPTPPIFKGLVILTEYQCVTDGHTDRHTQTPGHGSHHHHHHHCYSYGATYRSSVAPYNSTHSKI